MGIPVLKEAKSLAEVHSQSMAITKMASDLVNEPLVQNGYMLSGQTPAVAFINVTSMAKKRLQQFFPAANWKDPLFERLMSEAKLICAECIHLKYECRERRQPYDHLKDATIRIQKLVRDVFNQYSDIITALENKDAQIPLHTEDNNNSKASTPVPEKQA